MAERLFTDVGLNKREAKEFVDAFFDVVRDALGSRRSESKETAIRRMERNGAEIVTTEMVVFEWLGTADDPRLRSVIALVK